MSTFCTPPASNRVKEVVEMFSTHMRTLLITVLAGTAVFVHTGVRAQDPVSRSPSAMESESTGDAARGAPGLFGPAHGRGKVLVAFALLTDEERDELVRLRAEDPEKARQVSRQKIKEKIEYLTQLEESDPQKFEEVTAQGRRDHEMRRYARRLALQSLSDEEKKSLTALKETDPHAAFDALAVKVKEKLAYLRDLQTNDPEKYRGLIDSFPGRGPGGLARELVFETLGKEKQRELLAMKEKDPGAFQAFVAETLKVQWKELQAIKKNDPEKFKEITQQARQCLRKRIEYLREKDPDRFNKMMEQGRRRRQERMAEICKDDPEQCRALKEKKRDHIQRILVQLKDEDPETYAHIQLWIQDHK